MSFRFFVDENDLGLGRRLSHNDRCVTQESGVCSRKSDSSPFGEPRGPFGVLALFLLGGLLWTDARLPNEPLAPEQNGLFNLRRSTSRGRCPQISQSAARVLASASTVSWARVGHGPFAQQTWFGAVENESGHNRD